MDDLPLKPELLILIDRGQAAHRLFEKTAFSSLALPVWVNSITEARTYLAGHQPAVAILGYPLPDADWDDVLALMQAYAANTRMVVLSDSLDVSHGGVSHAGGSGGYPAAGSVAYPG
jgi:hypothetical protein